MHNAQHNTGMSNEHAQDEPNFISEFMGTFGLHEK
jgi:hypothetical protein